eukprot:6197783-Pleurochrysis_carterae.AAC.2
MQSIEATGVAGSAVGRNGHEGRRGGPARPLVSPPTPYPSTGDRMQGREGARRSRGRRAREGKRCARSWQAQARRASRVEGKPCDAPRSHSARARRVRRGERGGAS